MTLSVFIKSARKVIAAIWSGWSRSDFVGLNTSSYTSAVGVLLREHRDTASAGAFFEQALGRSGEAPSTIITDHHQPYIKAKRSSGACQQPCIFGAGCTAR